MKSPMIVGSPMIVDRLILSYEIQVGEKDGIMCEEFSLHGTL